MFILVNIFSAGEEWTENPETYESSFYKRTLDNDVYIFTAPSFNSKCAGSSLRAFIDCGSSVHCFQTSSQPYWQQSRLYVSDTTFSILVLFLLCFATHPLSLFPPPVYILSSPLISLTDSRTGECQCYSHSVLDWINTCSGFTDS